jgi:type I restriction enzyme, R subunit
LGWLADVGYTTLYGPDIAPDGPSPERTDYRQVLLVERLQARSFGLNPDIPAAAREDAVKQVLDLGIPAAGRKPAFSSTAGRWRAGAVPEGRRNARRLRAPDRLGRLEARNEWLAINQFTIKGPQEHAPAGHHPVRQWPAAGAD